MQILEEYWEVIERDTIEISHMWKYVQVFLYLSCALSGYVCSVLFYVIWEHIFEGNCPLWAKPVSILMIESELDIAFDKDEQYSCTNWWKYVITDYAYKNRCKMYLITCFLSCMFGIVWFTLFLMCGKGRHDRIIYEASWRIMFPAIFFDFIFVILITYTTYNLEKGYEEFNKEIRNIFLKICSSYEIKNDISGCEIMQMYVNTYNFDEHDVCNMLLWLQVFSLIMIWSWIGTFIILIIRVIVIADFRIFKITIYEVPYNHVLSNANMHKVQGNDDKNKEKKL